MKTESRETARSVAWDLPIAGLTRFTTLDFPGRLAAVVFTQGCLWRCRYCHNPHLRHDGAGSIEPGDVVAFLARRIGLLDGVVFSGGEPTLHAGLPGALRHVRAMGFETGLHTTGMDSAALEEALDCCDWVGMDVKAPFGSYERITGASPGGGPEHSVDLLLDSGVEHEFRTTYHPSLLTADDLVQIASDLAARGARRYVIQRFRPDGCADLVLEATGSAQLPPDVEEVIRPLFKEFTVR